MNITDKRIMGDDFAHSLHITETGNGMDCKFELDGTRVKKLTGYEIKGSANSPTEVSLHLYVDNTEIFID